MHNEILARYEQAQAIAQGPISNSVTMNDTVYPHWIEGTQCFWYRRETKSGKEFQLVDPVAASNTVAFDHKALADALQLASAQTVNPEDLPLKDVSLTLAPLLIRFQAFDKHWLFDASQAQCQEEEVKKQILCSPDGKKEVFVQNFNLWIRDRLTGEEQALTQGGTEDNSFARSSTSTYDTDPNTIQVLWSPDSSRLLTVQLDSREVQARAMIDYVPQDGSIQPQLTEVAFPYPGDEKVDTYKLLVIDISTGHMQEASYRPLPFKMYTDFCLGFFSVNLAWWATDNQRAFFVDITRGSKVVRLVELDTHTGTTRVLFEESSDTFVKLHHEGLLDLPFYVPLPESNELIWFSERSGWGHLYLYDLSTGQLKHSITEGEWLVRDILHFDAKNREILVQTAARDAEISPY